MRAGLGLLTLLIGAAIIFYVSFGGKQGGLVGTEMKAGKEAQDQVNQMGGKDEDGVKAEDSIVMQEVESGSELRRIKVVSLVPGGPMEKAYGLVAGDEIAEADQLELRGMDPSLAKSLVITGYAENKPLVILRNDQTMTLTPNTALTKMHPNLFGKPGVKVDPNSVIPGQAIPSH